MAIATARLIPEAASDRRTAAIAGIVFIVATAAALASAAFLPSLSGSDYLAGIDAGAGRMIAGVLFLMLAAVTSAAIAVVMYPVMRRWSPGLALFSVIFRALEGTFYIVAVVFLMTLLSLSHQYVAAAGPEQAALQAIGDTLRAAREHAALVAVFCFCLGAFAYYALFYWSRLIPRWLAGFGIVAILMMFSACFLALLSDSPITGYVFLLFPILVQEMVLAVWLIARGFDTRAASVAASGA